uniref:EF-hand domain-containing protein n=1 Tax=Alexandrium monilatum TaxID=311494 RepID=A0A7S4W3Q6_9DINO
MPRRSLPALLGLLLVLGGGSPVAASFERSLAPSSPGQLALLAVLAGRGLAEEGAEGEGAEDKETEGEDGGEDGDKVSDAMESAHFLEVFDKNKDGLLELQELEQLEDAIFEDRELMKKLIAESDSDGDGKIRREELLSLFRAFEREEEKQDAEGGDQ